MSRPPLVFPAINTTTPFPPGPARIHSVPLPDLQSPKQNCRTPTPSPAMAPPPSQVALQAAIDGNLRLLKSKYPPNSVPRSVINFLVKRFGDNFPRFFTVAFRHLQFLLVIRDGEEGEPAASQGHRGPERAPPRRGQGPPGGLQVSGGGVGARRQLRLHARCVRAPGPL